MFLSLAYLLVTLDTSPQTTIEQGRCSDREECHKHEPKTQVAEKEREGLGKDKTYSCDDSDIRLRDGFTSHDVIGQRQKILLLAVGQDTGSYRQFP